MLPVCLAVLRRRPPRCEILFVIIDPTRGAGQEFGQPSGSPAIGAVLAMVGHSFAATWGAVISSAEDSSPKCRERMTHFALLVRRRARRDGNTGAWGKSGERCRLGALFTHRFRFNRFNGHY